MYVHDKVRARMRDAKVRTWGHEPRPPPPSFVYSFETHQSADDAHTRHDYFFENTYFFPPQKTFLLVTILPSCIVLLFFNPNSSADFSKNTSSLIPVTTVT